MAERRMFAKTIVLSDAFLDMPLSARCLYFTLGMLADDDGFVNSPKSIMRQCGASDGDMQTLLDRKFVILFDSGVVVIKHWRIHNYIQKDRYKPTKYQEEKGKLTEKANGVYSLDTKCIHDVSSLDTQVRLELGKVSIKSINTLAQNDAHTDSQNASNAEVIDAVDAWFLQFWKAYPKKVNKKVAYKRFVKACKDQETFNAIMTGLNNQVQATFSKRELKFVPAPDVWINQERWNDEIIPETAKRGKRNQRLDEILMEEHLKNEQGRNSESAEDNIFGVPYHSR